MNYLEWYMIWLSVPLFCGLCINKSSVIVVVTVNCSCLFVQEFLYCLLWTYYYVITVMTDTIKAFLSYHIFFANTVTTPEMWANAQRDGRPAKHRWRPLFNAAKFGWRPLVDCRAVTLPRCESRWNSLGCPKLVNRSQPLVVRTCGGDIAV